jgi:hypothetical protein
MSLAILQRSDSELSSVTTTDNVTKLANKLAEMQPFSVQVFAEFYHKAALLPQVQELLQEYHYTNGWYAMSATKVVNVVCKALMPQEEQETTKEDAQDTSEDDETPQLQQIDPAWHLLLESCTREEADKATVIRRTLKKTLGRWQADSVLSNYKEACLRIGPCGRYILNAQGQTMRLAQQTEAA